MAQKFYEKATVQSAIIGTVITGLFGLIIAGMYIWNIRSELYINNRALKKEIGRLEKKVEELRIALAPFEALAVKKYQKKDVESLKKIANRTKILEESDKLKSKEIIKLKETISKSKCNLDLLSKKIKKNGKNYELELVFKPTKTIHLGLLQFGAKLPKNGKVKIIDFFPTEGKMVFHIARGMPVKKDNDRIAILHYSLSGFGYPTITLTVSGATPAIIKSNYFKKVMEFNIK